jgi:cytoskeletal protein RodZ
MPFRKALPSEEDQPERWKMKFRNMIRMQVMILAGVGVATLLASSAYAQQEMDPTPFDDGPYVEPMAQPVATTSAATASPAEMNSANFRAASPSQVERSAVWSPADEMSLTGLLACAVCILLYEIAKAKRENQVAQSRTSYLPRGASTL